MDSGIEAIRAARRELDAVIEEIRAVPGYHDFLAAPSFDDVARVAAVDHPLVYFAAADLGGLALVVRGEEVTHVPLDEMTADVVRERVGTYLAAYDGYRTASAVDQERAHAAWRTALQEVTAWSWTVVEPVLDELGTVGQAVFVPGGLLGLLPLHAAWTAEAPTSAGTRYALDTLTTTYVPNARALAAARRLARRPAERLVTVTDPPHSHDVARLLFAPVETRLAEHALPAAPVRIEPEAATVRPVLDELVKADVAHLACHGFAHLATPLESGLLLADGEVLRLRDLLNLRTHLRLAVLSACETSVPGTELPDEVVSLPTGLLQAGVGGVVASLWAVPDLSTTLLMGQFYRGWRREGLAPPEALRCAQLWLRDTSNAEKSHTLESAIDDGWLPEETVDPLLDALFRRDEDDRDLTAWAGFAYVGA